MATYAVGDLQGCYDEFATLLDRLQFDEHRDHLWLTGDLVNRGPQSLLCLRAVKSLGSAVTTVLGNHDLHLLAVAHLGTKHSRADDTLIDVLTAPDRDDLLDWLLHQPLLQEDTTLDYLMVHAGLSPHWDKKTATLLSEQVSKALLADPRGFLESMYGDKPTRWSSDLSESDRLRYAVNCFTRLRYVAADGALMLKYKGPPSTAPADVIPWFQSPLRMPFGQRVLFGHWSALGLYATPDFLGIDTGCVWGGALTAVRLDQQAPICQVPCLQAHPQAPTA